MRGRSFNQLHLIEARYYAAANEQFKEKRSRYPKYSGIDL